MNRCPKRISFLFIRNPNDYSYLLLGLIGFHGNLAKHGHLHLESKLMQGASLFPYDLERLPKMKALAYGKV